ncbi:hypothetical protein ACWDA7_44200 [Streptomyces sp. NPDC001156]
MATLAPAATFVPSGFKLYGSGAEVDLTCNRDGCAWQRELEGGVHLTELVALVAEHMQEAHG